MAEIVDIVNEKMQKTLDLLQEDFQGIRAGRANPHVLDKLRVDYYGTPSTIQQVANVSVPEPRILMIAPWEKSLLAVIAKEIQKSDIGITPQSDGQVLRLAFPEMTEDRRKELAKEIKKKAEDAKVSLRNIRRDANERTKKMEKSGDYTEDDVKDQEKEIQKITDKFIKLIDEAADKKTKDIMTV
ncbi:MAG: ribosome recycling factor [Lachnospiraceae bacterium]|nr:ribosome recycling factor [Lachnospiraceae bacterium]MBQ3400381.1 ribosome recycling factor [Lachnospiraceae bacterium]